MIMISLAIFKQLQQFKCNEYITKWCSIKQLTKIPELNVAYS